MAQAFWGLFFMTFDIRYSLLTPVLYHFRVLLSHLPTTYVHQQTIMEEK